MTDGLEEHDIYCCVKIFSSRTLKIYIKIRQTYQQAVAISTSGHQDEEWPL